MATRLAVSRAVILDSAGYGTVTIGPERWPETWNVTRMSTTGNSTIEPVLNVYRGMPGGNLLDMSKKGNSDISEIQSSLKLLAGELMTAEYVGGTPGAEMIFYVEGEASRGI